MIRIDEMLKRLPQDILSNEMRLWLNFGDDADYRRCRDYLKTSTDYVLAPLDDAICCQAWRAIDAER